ncbi:MAG: DUF4153 domain-containing protein [Pseudomonadota bacterium]
MTESPEADAWETAEPAEGPATWPIRPLLLAVLGLATGLGAHFLLGNEPFYRHQPSAAMLAELAVITVTAGLIGFTIERRLWWASIAFSVAFGVLAGAVTWWNGDPEAWSGGDGWRMGCLFLAIAIAAPLFQAARDAGAVRFRYAAVHDHAWTNIVLWGACWIFVGIVFALAWLLAGLFDLIKIHFLRDLLQENWFGRALVGAAFGAALGLLREHGVVVRLLQRVVATVLAVLAPVLAVGLVLFVLALPFTGLGALWEATSATTPVLLCCIVGALILANSVIGELPEHERTFPLLRMGAMGLGLVMLPLAVIAAIAVGLRIGQYGFTPERLWALTFVILACAFGLAYLVSLVRGRMNWAEKVRPANLVLAFAVCGIALLLATPLVSFNAISTRDQVARLESGRIAPEKFDWRALAFDFGQQGRDALGKLAASGNAAIRAQALAASKTENRYDVSNGDEARRAADLATTLRILPQGTALPGDLRAAVVGSYPCGRGGNKCTLTFLPGGTEALLLDDSCFVAPVPAPTPAASPGEATMVIESSGGCIGRSQDRFALVNGKWAEAQTGGAAKSDADKAKAAAGYKAGQIEIRTVERRQAFVGGVPVGDAFE